MGAKFDKRAFERELKKATQHLEQQIPVPLEGSEDDAVAAVIADYKRRTRVVLDEGEVRKQVRELRTQAAGG